MRPLLAALYILCLGGTSLAQDYEDATGIYGIQHTFLDNGTFGGGASFVDFDMDGWDDVTLASHFGDSVYFYRNVGGQALMRIQMPGIETTCQQKQVMWVDLDNDGDRDFFAACHGQPNKLYENTGGMQFEDITVEAGLDTISEYTFGTSFGDIDRDGDLDMVIFNRALVNNRNIILYRNDGYRNFTNITLEAGVNNIPVGPFCGTFIDYNEDNWPDLYIAQDKYFGNNLFENNGDGTFTDVSAPSGLGHELDAMCVAPGDYDNDGDVDIYITNTPLEGNHMFTNNGDFTYTETAAGTPLVVNGYDWGANFFDVENDGDLDLYISGIYTNGSDFSSWLYRNHGGGNLSPSVPGMPNDSYLSYSNAIGDIDRDGFPDIVVNNYDETRSKLWRNLNGINGSTNNWIKVRLKGTVSNIDGYGSMLKVYSGGQMQIRYTYCGEGFIGQNAQHELFGLGASTVDSVVITWPSGLVTSIVNPPVNQELNVLETETHTATENPVSPFSVFHSDGSGIISFSFKAALSSNAEVSVFAADGRRMRQFDQGAVPVGTMQSFDLRELPKGVYFFQLKWDGGSWSESFLR